MKPSGFITLTTDFGLKDPYVGLMKGVIASINPSARTVDITHQIRPGSIVLGSGIIMESYPYFSDGTVHVVVVDPGVGGTRRPILVETERHYFVGPDNGLFWPLIAASPHIRLTHLTETAYFLPQVSHTFHGRDIFAPVAAHLSAGVSPRKMGHLITDPVALSTPVPQQSGNRLEGHIMRVDHFGNLITNIHIRDLKRFLGKARPVIMIQGLMVEGMRNTYEGAEEGELLALVGSTDHLEIAVNLGRACDLLGVDDAEIIGLGIHVTRA